jgi:glycerate dehydrogenase
MDFRLVFLDAATFGNASFRHFKDHWDCTIHDLSTPTEVLKRLQGFNVVIVNKVVLDRSVLNFFTAKELKLIAVAATGTDNIDLDAARERGIRVCNVPQYATRSVAQFTMALILELMTHVGGYAELVRKGNWQKSRMFTLLDFPSSELRGKLGIIGYGAIGRAVAGIARGFGMEVAISARPGSSDSIPEGRMALDALLTWADVVSLHCPLTPETQNLIDSQTLALMKPTAFLVNTARGGLVDERPLIKALEEKRLAGAALDVLSQEPPPPDHPIIQAAQKLDNLLVTPHCAWTAREARQRLLDEVAENILAFTEGKERNCVV